MQRIQGDVLRGHLEGMVLAALSRGEAHGFEVLHRLEELGCGALSLKEGTLYPVLYRLEAAGLVKAAWEDDSSDRRGPRRRIYRLNEKGASDLARRRGLGELRNGRGGDIGGTGMSTSVFRDHIELRGPRKEVIPSNQPLRPRAAQNVIMVAGRIAVRWESAQKLPAFRSLDQGSRRDSVRLLVAHQTR